MVIRLTLAYDGTDFKGWAIQRSGVRTVEGVVKPLLEQVAGHPLKISVAGRTDAGVHARGQVISFEADAQPVDLAGIVNGLVGPEVVVTQARRAPAGFDARFSATAREYRYVIDTASVADPFTARFSWHRPGPLSIAAMRRAAAPLLGSHDFATFGAPPVRGGSTVRQLQKVSVARREERVEIVVRANAFLRHMVRNLVASLVLVGDGRWREEALLKALEARDRGASAKAAPPQGLTLERVLYRPVLTGSASPG